MIGMSIFAIVGVAIIAKALHWIFIAGKPPIVDPMAEAFGEMPVNRVPAIHKEMRHG